MNQHDLRAFVHRGWAASRGRLDYWAERYRLEGPLPARQASTALYEHARCLQSTIFGDEYRANDLAHHLRVRDRLDRAARAITGR